MNEMPVEYGAHHAARKPDEPMARPIEYPATGSEWRHRTSSIVYEVIDVANLAASDPQKWPAMVVYMDPMGVTWARPLTEWHNKFKELK